MVNIRELLFIFVKLLVMLFGDEMGVSLFYFKLLLVKLSLNMVFVCNSGLVLLLISQVLLFLFIIVVLVVLYQGDLLV